MNEVFFARYVPKSGTIEVPPDGSLDAPIALVGEAPGKNEIAQGIPFVGKSGELLSRLLSDVGLTREDCYITNLFKFEVRKAKVRSGSSYAEAFFKGKQLLWRSDTGFTMLGLESKESLLKELKSFKGNVIVPLGNAALFALIGETHITKRRGSVYWHPTLERKVIPTIHPAASFRNYLDRHLIKMDLRRIKEEAKTREMNEPEVSIMIEPTFTEAKTFLERCLHSREVAFDIETLRTQMSCISFAPNDKEAMSIPFVVKGENYFTLEQEVELMDMITSILENPEITKIGQNIAFDMTYLFMRYGIRTENWQDTMIAHKILYPEFPMGLDFITAEYTRFPYYKDEGKDQLKAPHDWQKYWAYNAKDSLVLMTAFPLIARDLKRIGNWDAYLAQKKLIHPLIYMGQHGIRVDKERIDGLRLKAEKEKEEILKELTRLVGHEINPNSSDQCKKYFYGEKKLKPYVEKGKPTMNEGALVRLKRRGFKEADLILKYRSLNTMITRYYSMTFRQEKDGHYRFTSFYKPVTAMGRLASTKDLDGMGGNAQNQPKKMNVAFVADPGFLIFNVDLSQADARSVAYIGNVRKMIEAFENGTDIHSLTASGIFNIPPDEIKRMDKEGIKAPLGYGDQTHRYWGKKCLTGEAEILTEFGWKPIAEISSNLDIRIAQYDPIARSIEFVKPIDYYVEEYKGEFIEAENKAMHIKATPDHKILVFNTKTERVYESGLRSLQSFKKTNKWTIPTAGFFLGGEEVDLALVALLVAYQADGSLNSSKGMVFKFQKKRKKDRLLQILEYAKLRYNERKDGSIYIPYDERATDFILKYVDGKKNFSFSLITKLGLHARIVFLHELLHWDGYKNQYFNTSKQSVDVVQTIAHLSGLRAHKNQIKVKGNRKPLYRITFNSAQQTSISTLRESKTEEQTTIYCPTVKSGFFLIRSNGKISITGNCNHSLNFDIGYKRFSFMLEIPESQGKELIEKYHSLYPEVREGYQKTVRDQLSRSRTVTNCFGRKFLLLGRWDDELFKEGYAFPAQSNTVEIINRWGLNEFYYNDEYKEVDLLRQVHDSINFQIRLSLGTREMAKLLLKMKTSIERPLRWEDRTFIIPSDWSAGFDLWNQTKLRMNEGEESLAKQLDEIIRSNR